jgi:hypothetical protein
MSEHTQGHWLARGRYIKQDFTSIGLGEESGCLLANVMGGHTSGPYFIQNNHECDANARRIVACVNACEGLSNEKLDAILELHGSIGNYIEYVRNNK